MKVHSGMEVRCCGQRAQVQGVRETKSGALVDITYLSGTWVGIDVTVREDALEPVNDLARPRLERPAPRPVGGA